MSELLREQEKEINDCFKSHLMQTTNVLTNEKPLDWKKIFAYLTFLMDYECFLFSLNKENMELLRKTFELITKIFSEISKDAIHESFKGYSEAQLRKLQIIFFSNASKYQTTEISEEVEIEAEKDEFTYKQPLPIAKNTLKNFKDILEY